MTTITKERVEWLTKISSRDEIDDIGGDEIRELARIALASLEAEPVACPKCNDTGMADSGGVQPWGEPISIPCDCTAQPALAVDADDNFYSWFGREWHDHYQQNKYTTAAKQMLGVMAESAWKAGRRAAMLQSFGNSEQLNEIGSWNNHKNTPTAKPAIDTCELIKQIEGMEVSVDVSTCDADAGHRYFGTVTEVSELDTAKNGYILLVQDAEPNFKPAGNSPVIPDCWVPCSERMPDNDESKPIAIFTGKCLGQGMFVATYDDDGFFDYWEGMEIIGVTHWMKLPEPPNDEN
ncbi:DUF551 domain-containing protein [Citrobacter sp. RHB21-C01]|uniref:DUF551 domain-containing protein n=1 Tax=Citrobacter sp. RHB21-C01 TaxID=2742622 RepID=UPI0034D667AD